MLRIFSWRTRSYRRILCVLLEIGRRVGGSIPLTGAVDEVAVFNVALEEEDIKDSMEKGMERVLGIAAVSPSDKLAVTWGQIKK